MDKTNPKKHLVDKETKPKRNKPPRGSIIKKKNGTFKAILMVDGIKINLGVHKTKEAAERNYWSAQKYLPQND